MCTDHVNVKLSNNKLCLFCRRKHYNVKEALDLLFDDDAYRAADIIITPPENQDILESDQDSADEDDPNADHMSGNQLMAKAMICIVSNDGVETRYGFEEDEDDDADEESEDSGSNLATSNGNIQQVMSHSFIVFSLYYSLLANTVI